MVLIISHSGLSGILKGLLNLKIHIKYFGRFLRLISNTTQFISQGAWRDEVILKRHWQEVDQDLGEENGVLITDGSDFHKQGYPYNPIIAIAPLAWPTSSSHEPVRSKRRIT